jgi:protein O-mannosyl-transferase
MTDQPASRSSLLPFALGIGLFLVVFGVYARSLFCDFVNFDDPLYVSENAVTRAGLSPAGVAWAFTAGHAGNYHPLTWLSLQLDTTLFGTSPFGYHLTNVLLHAASTVLLFVVLRGMTGALWPAVVVAALFGLHPLHVESVSWISERKDTLSAFFWLLTMLAYLSYVRRPTVVRYLLVLVGLALGLLAKPMVVTLPCVLLLLDFWPLGRIRWGQALPSTADTIPTRSPVRLVLEKLPMFALIGVLCAVTILVQRQFGLVKNTEEYSLSIRVANALYAYVKYLEQTLTPLNLAVFYQHRQRPLADGTVLVSAAVLMVVSGICLGLWRRAPWLAVGWFWYLGTLVPVIGLMQVGLQSHADRYTYIPHIGLLIAVVWTAAAMAQRWRVAGVILAQTAAVVVVLCGVTTWQQQAHWRNSFALWDHAKRVTSPNALTLSHVALELANQDDYAEALRHARAARDLNPSSQLSWKVMAVCCVHLDMPTEARTAYERLVELNPEYAPAHFDLGRLLINLGESENAIRELSEAIRREPMPQALQERARLYIKMQRLDEARADLLQLVELGDNGGEVQFRLGLVALQQNRKAEAAERFEAVELRGPQDAQTWFRLSVAWERLGEPRALAAAEKALSFDPNAPLLIFNLAYLLEASGRHDDSQRQYARALALAPQWASQTAALAWNLATTGDGDRHEALRLAKQAVQAAPSADAFEALAAAHAALGQFPEAVEAQKRALADPGTRLVAEMQTRLKLYEQGKAFVQMP